MGLFGGFRAKLLGKEKRKKQNNEAVCIKFKVFSEFDSPENLDIRPGKSNVVVKTRKIPQKTNIKNVIFNGQSSSTENTEVTELSQTTLNTEHKKATETKNKKKEAPKIPNAKENSKKIVNNSNHVQLQKDIQENNENSKKKEDSKEEHKQEHNENKLLNEEESSEENFAIQIVNHQANNFYSNLNSEDEISETDDEHHSLYDTSPINYSSQASNIFFGGGDGPDVVRPRKMIISDDTVSEGSSASA